MLFATPDNVLSLLHFGIIALGTWICGAVIGNGMVWLFHLWQESTPLLSKKELQSRLISLWLPSVIGLILLLLGVYLLLALIIVVLVSVILFTGYFVAY